MIVLSGILFVFKMKKKNNSELDMDHTVQPVKKLFAEKLFTFPKKSKIALPNPISLTP